jgi:hypothetical protein
VHPPAVAPGQAELRAERRLARTRHVDDVIIAVDVALHDFDLWGRAPGDAAGMTPSCTSIQAD